VESAKQAAIQTDPTGVFLLALKPEFIRIRINFLRRCIMKSGGFKLQNFETCNLPEPVASAFDRLFGHLVGTHYKPVLYCATQQVNGVNHLIICEITKVTNPPVKSLQTVLMNIPINDLKGEKATMVAFDPNVIVEE
jgi:hypothetical protein